MLRVRNLLLSLASLTVFVLSPAFAAAHQTGKSHFVVHVRPGDSAVDTVLDFPAVDLADHLEIDTDGDGTYSEEELTEGRPEMLDYLESKIAVRADGKACRTVERRAKPLRRASERMTYMEGFACDSMEEFVSIDNRAMTEMATGYLHFGRIQVGESEEVETTAFNVAFPTYDVRLAEETGDEDEGDEGDGSLWDLMLRFIWQGLLHIAIGLDHILFVVALVLVSRDLRRLITVVTAFTIAHSVTLAIAALEVFTLPASVVEPIIAASILWVAAEAWFRTEESKFLFATTFLLGLVHGFGFSYVLADVGLPKEGLLPALFSFNVGVELGQLAIVVLLWPLRKWSIGKAWEQTAVRVCAAVLGAVALYWLVTRTFGL